MLFNTETLKFVQFTNSSGWWGQNRYIFSFEHKDADLNEIIGGKRFSKKLILDDLSKLE